MYLDFKDKFDGDDIVFRQKCVIGLQQIGVYQLKESSEIDVVKALTLFVMKGVDSRFRGLFLPHQFEYLNQSDFQ